MRRLLATLTLFLSLLSFVAIPIAAQHEGTAKQQTQSQTVYITRTGKKYHRGDCRYLSQSKIEVSLKDAKARGFTPCKVCHPPQ
jgi:hypothetical protein